MAQHPQQINIRNFRTTAALGFILGAVAFGIIPLVRLGFVAGFTGLDPYLLRVIYFTLWQATLSTGFSLLIAIPVAIALARQEFWGRGFLLRVFSIPLALPAIVAILGIMQVFGNEGWLGGAFPIYGLSGIIFAHVFFNMPLAVRLLLTRLEAIPDENFRLAAQLGFTDSQVLRFISWPQMASALIGIASLIFLLCTASFAVVLILGGGPQATTLEVAIYQSLRLDFDPAHAAVLALAQMVVCAILVFIAAQFATDINVAPRSLARSRRFDGATGSSRVIDGMVLILAIVIIVPPIAAVMFAGLGSIRFDASLGYATLTSLGIGISSALLSLILGWILAFSAAKTSDRLLRGVIGVACLAALIMPPAVLATGWFLTLAPVTDVSQLAIYLVILLNALMALPFVWSPLYPEIIESLQRHDRLCESLGLSGLARLRIIDVPVLRRPLALAFIMAVIVSLGDLSAITLFGDASLVTLPALIMKQMGHYRMSDAAGTAVVLTALCFVLLTLGQKWSHQHDQT